MRLASLLPLLLLGAGTLHAADAPEDSRAALALEPCRLSAVEGRVEAEARCGRLLVPLDWDDRQGPAIELKVAVLPALSENPEPDPLVAIAGGPGQAATEAFVAQQGAFARVLRTRDLVLVDQRGTGESAPLDCPVPEDTELRTSAGAALEFLRGCLDGLEHDAALFTTSVAVRDLDAVRSALGYETVNVYGVSYGSRVAQHYLRRYEEHVRTVILDGVVPPGLALGVDVALESQRALDFLFERCASEALCAAAYPNLREDFYAVLEALETPRTVSLQHPRTGNPATLELDRFKAAGVVRMLVYAPENTAVLPNLVAQARAGNYAPLAAMVLLVEQGMDGQISQGLNFSVVCAEDQPYWGEVDVRAQNSTYLGDVQVDVLGRACEFWPRGPVDDDLREPVVSDRPVLVLSGEADPITPPAYGERVLPGLRNSRHLIVNGHGHGMLGVSCVPRLIAQFIDAGDAAGLDVTCLMAAAPFPVFVTPLGPAP